MPERSHYTAMSRPDHSKKKTATKAAATTKTSTTPRESPRMPYPHDCTYERMPDGTIYPFRQPIRVF